MLKRTFDIVFSIVGLVVLSPILLTVALLVKLTSRGPVFYRGVRTGLHGKPFRIYKFRSMIVDAEKVGGTTTADRDPRITRVGHFLRKFKIDEFPQLLNVLKGEMSFVGPRPEVAEYTDSYTDEEKMILSVKPGITDFSSIEFHDLQAHLGAQNAEQFFRNHILKTKNQLRIKYVREKSFWIDMKILFVTMWILAKKPFVKRLPRC